MDNVSSTVREAVREWRRLGVLPTTRSDLQAELQADLTAAVEDGRPLSDIVGHDVARFARDWAYARGDVPVRPYYALSTAAAVGGLVLGGVVGIGLVVFVDSSSSVLADWSSRFGSGFSVGGDHRLLAGYVVAGLGAYAGALAGIGVALRRRNDPFVRATVRQSAWTLAAGAVVALLVAVAMAAAEQFYATGSFVLGELLVVLAIVVGSVLLARRRAVGVPAVLSPAGRSLADAPAALAAPE